MPILKLNEYIFFYFYLLTKIYSCLLFLIKIFNKNEKNFFAKDLLFLKFSLFLISST